jgi:hypothetical protein
VAKDEAAGKHRQFDVLNIQDTAVQVPIQACNNTVVEGVLGLLAKNQRLEGAARSPELAPPAGHLWSVVMANSHCLCLGSATSSLYPRCQRA